VTGGGPIETPLVGSEEPAAIGSLVNGSKTGFHVRLDQRHRPHAIQPRRNRLQMVIACHPVESIKDPQVERLAVASEGLFPLDIEVLFEVGKGQFPQGPVERLAKPETHEIGLPYRTPKPVTAIEGEQVLVVAVIGYELEDERGISKSPQRGRRKKSTVEAVGLTIPEDPKRTAVDLLNTVGNRIEKLLDPERAAETANECKFFRCELFVETSDCPHLPPQS